MSSWELIAAIAVVCAGISAILWVVAENAPEGYQDESGFHYGEPDDTDDAGA